MLDAELDHLEAILEYEPYLKAGTARKLIAEVRRLRQLVYGLADRVARQSELLARRAEASNQANEPGTAHQALREKP